MEVNITQKQFSYLSYLLRLWQAGKGLPPEQVWRASLENPHTGEILNFTSLQRLFEFLTDQCRFDLSSQGTPSENGMPH